MINNKCSNTKNQKQKEQLRSYREAKRMKFRTTYDSSDISPYVNWTLEVRWCNQFDKPHWKIKKVFQIMAQNFFA